MSKFSRIFHIVTEVLWSLLKLVRRSKEYDDGEEKPKRRKKKKNIED